MLPDSSEPTTLDFLEHGADDQVVEFLLAVAGTSNKLLCDFTLEGAENQGVEFLLDVLGTPNRLFCSSLSCLAKDLHLSQSIVHNFFFGENSFMICGEIAPATDPVLSTLDAPLLPLPGVVTDTNIASFLPSKERLIVQ